MRKFYYELDTDEDNTYVIIEEDDNTPYGRTYWCWLTDEEDAKDLVGLLHKLQGTEES